MSASILRPNQAHSGFFMLLLVGLLLPGCTATEADVIGDWEGPLTNPDGSSLRVVFHITRDAEGTLNAIGDSPDQGGEGLAADEVRFEEGQLFIRFERVNTTFTGTLQHKGKVIEGSMNQRGDVLPLRLERVGG